MHRCKARLDLSSLTSSCGCRQAMIFHVRITCNASGQMPATHFVSLEFATTRLPLIIAPIGLFHNCSETLIPSLMYAGFVGSFTSSIAEGCLITDSLTIERTLERGRALVTFRDIQSSVTEAEILERRAQHTKQPCDYLGHSSDRGTASVRRRTQIIARLVRMLRWMLKYAWDRRKP